MLYSNTIKQSHFLLMVMVIPSGLAYSCCLSFTQIIFKGGILMIWIITTIIGHEKSDLFCSAKFNFTWSVKLIQSWLHTNTLSVFQTPTLKPFKSFTFCVFFFTPGSCIVNALWITQKRRAFYKGTFFERIYLFILNDRMHTCLNEVSSLSPDISQLR